MAMVMAAKSLREGERTDRGNFLYWHGERERDRCNEVKLGREESLSWKTKKRMEKENSLSLSNLITKHKNFDTNTTPRTIL